MVEEDYNQNKNNQFNNELKQFISELDILTIGPAYNSDIIDFDINLIIDPLSELDYMNILLKKNVKENVDYIFINQRSWQYIEKKFGGFGIKRLITKSGENILIENNYLKLKLIVYPFEFTNIIGLEYIICSRYWNSDQFLLKIIRIVNSRKNNKNVTIDAKKIYLWRLSIDYDIHKFRKDAENLKYNSQV